MLTSPAAFAIGDPPTVLHVSEGVHAGDLLTLFGDSLGPEAELTFSDEEPCPIVSEDTDGRFVTCLLPAGSPDGPYQLTLTTANGSVAVDVNTAEPLYIDQPVGWSGQQIRVVGRDFEPSTDDVEVRLNNGSTTQTAVVTEHNNYSALFTVPGAAAVGSWNVEVSNDGGSTWLGLQEDQQLEVIAVGNDPLGLGVAWAGDFDWTPYLATAYGAIAGDAIDDTTALQAGIDDVYSEGGGVLELPAGELVVSSELSLPSGVSVVGQGKDATTILWNGTSTDAKVFGTKGDGKTIGLVGVSGLTVEVAEAAVLPNTFFWLGQDWGTHTTAVARVADRLYLNDVGLTYLMVEPSVARANGAYLLGDQFALVKDVTFVGYRAAIGTFGNEYTRYIDNYLSYADGQFQTISAYSSLTGNEVEGAHVNATTHQQRGLKVKTFAYVGDNHVSGVGYTEHNDGEAYLAENAGGGAKITADVASSSGTTLALTNLYNKGWNTLNNTNWGPSHYVVVVEGRGIGQMRPVVSWNSTTDEIVVGSAWDIPLDSTSRVAVTLPQAFNTFYDNSADNTAKGLTIYGDTYRTVIDSYTGTNTEGIYVSGIAGADRIRTDFSYFDDVLNSTITGKSPTSGLAFVTLRMHTGSGVTPVGYLFYGDRVVGNSLTGTTDLATDPNRVNGLTAYKWNTVDPHRSLALASVISRNSLDTFETGITVDEYTDGLLLHANTFTDVDVEYNTDLSPLPIVP